VDSDQPDDVSNGRHHELSDGTNQSHQLVRERHHAHSGRAVLRHLGSSFLATGPVSVLDVCGIRGTDGSGILRGIETFSQQRAWNDPDAVWVTLLGLVNWSANVFLPLYGVLQVVLGIMHYGGMGFRIYPGAPWLRHVVAAMVCFGLSGALRLAEFFIAQGAGGVS
jgi:hypothetical protein